MEKIENTTLDNYIQFTKEEMRKRQLPFLDCGVSLGRGRRASSGGLLKKPTHTDHYLMFDSHHPLEHTTTLGSDRAHQPGGERQTTAIYKASIKTVPLS